MGHYCAMALVLNVDRYALPAGVEPLKRLPA